MTSAKGQRLPSQAACPLSGHIPEADIVALWAEVSHGPLADRLLNRRVHSVLIENVLASQEANRARDTVFDADRFAKLVRSLLNQRISGSLCDRGGQPIG